MPTAERPPRVFHVLYFKNEQVQLSLDAIRFIGNEDEKMRAHITLGGPFRLRRKVPAAASKLDGFALPVHGVGTFFEGKQNTVFLECDKEPLAPFQTIRNYEFRPHITLYDGPSRDFAVRLLGLLDKRSIPSAVRISKPALYETTKGQLSLRLHGYYREAVSKFNIQVPRTPVAEWGDDLRLSLIDQFLAKLPADPA